MSRPVDPARTRKPVERGEPVRCLSCSFDGVFGTFDARMSHCENPSDVAFAGHSQGCPRTARVKHRTGDARSISDSLAAQRLVDLERRAPNPCPVEPQHVRPRLVDEARAQIVVAQHLLEHEPQRPRVRDWEP